ncbi:MAG TPA: outer membrane protein assembly factor BamC [Usitatibacter sp.]|nr:outer membrane protein assembly factor BamC [Usitatibacter sp.]
MMHLRTYAIPAMLALALAGCSWFGSSKPDYKSAQARADQPLEVPPELTAPTMDDRYAIPDPRTQTTYSQYSKAAGSQGSAPVAGTSSNTVLPKVEGARLERYGDQRWLVVKGEPDKVWPVIRDFWIENGYPLAREEPNTGIMETDWYDDKSKIPQDIVRRTVGKVLPSLWSTPRRDKFRTRLEKGAEPGTTEIFVSNRNVEEVYTNNNQDRTVWQSREADRDLEAEMLSRMLVKFGAAEQQVAAATAKAPAPVRSGAQPAAATSESRNAVLENSGAGPLVVNDSFDRAWRRVGLALDRVGFTVEDRDRSKGIFYVRYVDPEVDREAQASKNESWTDKLKFWKSTPKGPTPQYRIQVSDAGASMSQVQVQNSQGAAEGSSTGKKILGLLYEQLK